MKLPHQSTPPPVDDLDSSNKVHAESGGAGGPATQIDETGGPTTLDITTIDDGEVLVRSGTTITSQALGTPGAHATSHQDGETDEINVAGLSGKLADNQTAGELATTGAAVVVSGAAPPSAGQVLKATSATVASWDDESGGGGAHDLGGADHNADTLANLNSKVSDATLDSINDPRPADEIITTTGPTTMAVGAVADGQYLKRSGSTVVGDTPGGGGAADALSTTGADVNVSGAAPPSIGQVLKATGATTATWQDESGGSSVVAQGAYIQAKLSADQTGITADNTKIAFDTVHTSRGDLAVDGSGNFSTLKAGRTYFLLADLMTTTTTDDRFPYNWYDQTGAVDIGNTGTAVPPSEVSATGYTCAAVAVITPTVDTTVELRSSVAMGTALSVTAANGWGDHNSTAIIMEVGASSNVIGETILSAASDTISVTGLNGDLHGVYEVEWNLLLSDTGDPLITAEPNGVATNQYGTYAGNFGTPTGYTYWRIGSKTGETSRRATGTAKLTAARTQGGVSVDRTFITDCGMSFAASPYGIFQRFHGYWTDATSNLTSLDIVTDVASGFLAGSRVTVRKA